MIILPVTTGTDYKAVPKFATWGRAATQETSGIVQENECVPASQDCLRRRGKETTDHPEEVVVFWDGELRQTANVHVEQRYNGEDGKIGLQVIADPWRRASCVSSLLVSPC